MAQIPQAAQMNRSTPIQLMQQQTQNVSANPMAQVNSPAAVAASQAAANKQRHGVVMGTTSGPVMAVANPAVAQQMDSANKTQNKAM